MVKVQKLDRIGIWVRDLDEAKGFWGTLFETKFTRNIIVKQKVGSATVKVAFSPIGIELIQPIEPIMDSGGVQGFYLKVEDEAKAMEEMKSKGHRIEAYAEIDQLKHAVFNVRGIRFILTEYKGDNYGVSG